MDIKLENRSQNGSSDTPKSGLQAASTINMIASKLANSKAQQSSASEKLTKLSLALAQKPLTVGTNFASQSTTQLAILTSQAPTGAIAIVTSQPPLAQNQISLLTSQPSNAGNTTNQPSNNSVVSKMTEVLSLKQSPTLTKQLTTPISGTTNKVQVITAYMCRYCGQQFDSPSAMQVHIQNHVNGKTPHTCSVCGKEYRTPSKLQRHVRVHSGERPYACTLCGRRFTRSDHVKQHMKVHLQVKDLNICRLCNDMKFNRRQTLHLHLQQQHVIQQVFTCHRCGEAYESLEEMQSHKLTHDSVLNSLKDGGLRSLNAPLGVAKFALGPQKVDTVSKLEPIKTEKEITTDLQSSKKISIVDKIGPNGLYIPASFDHVMAPSNKYILEGMTKEAIELELQKKCQEELEQAKKCQDGEGDKHPVKMPQCYRVQPDGTCTSIDSKPTDMEIGENEECSKQATTFVSEDGMSMFILPNSTDDTDVEFKGDDDDEDDDDDDEDMEEIALGDQNSSKESGIGEEQEDGSEKMDEDDSNESKTKSHCIDGTKEVKISGKSTNHSENYSKPCPKSKKPGYVQESNNNITMQNSNATENKNDSKTDTSVAPKATSLLNSKLTELIKARVEQNNSSNSSQMPSVVSATNSYQRILPNTVSSLPTLTPMPKLTLIPTASSSGNPQAGTLQSYFLPLSSGSVLLSNTANKAAGTLAQTRVIGSAPSKPKQETPKLIRCEHCCIWFEDNAMSLLHNTLHAADESDPFTCRKCLKKLGNRLEFMAHLVWHLEPNMDI